jgi:hypothetical protein
MKQPSQTGLWAFARRQLFFAMVTALVSGGTLRAAEVPQSINPLQPYDGPSVRGVDTSTLTGKVMTGYQGWFNCEGDGAGLGWTHWARNKSKPFAPGNVTVDLWPDVSELTAGERFPTGFQFADGRPAEVFSSFNRETVLRHFRWMREYGIDGAFVQRFANGVKDEALRHHKDVVLANCREGANREGRAYAVMYDLSGLPAGGVARVRDDWKMLRKQMHIGADPAYLRHRGKPLVAVWGVGFSDRKQTLHPRRMPDVDRVPQGGRLRCDAGRADGLARTQARRRDEPGPA